jgi:CRISPR-associated endonuclease Csn1
LNLLNNAIGFALVELEGSNNPTKINRLGVHCFSDGREDKSKASLCKARRLARSARKNRDRRIQRKHSIVYKFIKYGLVSSDEPTTHTLKKMGHPLGYRTKALDEPLTKKELARAIYGLSQKRGFSLLEREDDTDTEAGIRKKSHEIMISDMVGFRTVGEYLLHRLNNNKNIKTILDNNICPSRDMLEFEFDAIKENQIKHHADIDTHFWDDIKQTIFYQRPLKEPELGSCIVLKEEKRTFIATPSFKRVTCLEILADLNIRKGSRILPISIETKLSLYEELKRKGSIDKKELTARLCKGTEKLTLRNKKELIGDTTSSELAQPKYFGEAWFDFALEKQDEIAIYLVTKDPKTIYNMAKDAWGLKEENAKNLAIRPLSKREASTQPFSRKFLGMLLADMEQNFQNVQVTRKNLGYPEIKYNGGFENLKYYGEVIPHTVTNFRSGKPIEERNDEELYGTNNNPTLHIVFNRLRKLVNQLITTYGKPEQIIIRVQSSLKHSMAIQKKRELNKNARKGDTTEIRKKLVTVFNIPNPTWEHVLKYRLWVELNPSEPEMRFCPYTGIKITKYNLFTLEFVIDHIIPFSITYDDTIHNKTLMSATIKDRKFDKCPYDAFGVSEQYYKHILARVEKLPKEKIKLFNENAAAIARKRVIQQFIDANYISKSIAEYFTTICKDVCITNEKLMTLLKNSWNVQHILQRDFSDVEKLKNEETKKRTKNKKQKDDGDEDNSTDKDLRIIAADAAILGTVDSSLSILTKYALLKKSEREDFKVDAPWQGFMGDVVEKLNSIVVSQRSSHSKTGSFLKDTIYGTVHPITAEGANLCIRKSIFEAHPDKITDIKTKEKLMHHLSMVPSEKEKIRERLSFLLNHKLERIKDDKLKKSLVKFLETMDKGTKKETELAKRLLKEEIVLFSEITGIKTVNTYLKIGKPITIYHYDGTGQKHTKVQLSEENYSVTIWVLPQQTLLRNEETYKVYCPKGFDAKFVVTHQTLFEANQKEESRPHPAAQKLMVLHKNDMLLLSGQIYKVAGLDPCNARIIIRAHYKDKEKIVKSYQQLIETKIQKLAINEVGVIQKGQNLFEKFLKIV